MNFGIGTRGIIGTFYERLAVATAATWASRVAMLFNSDQASETYKWLGMSPAMREWVGQRLAKGLREQGLTIANKDFEATMEISVTDRRRDKTGQLMVRINELAQRAAGHWNSLLSTLILNGAGATSGLAYDGQYFFDNDHSEGSSGTLVNVLAAAQVPQLDVTTAAAPTALEMAQAILGCISYMLAFKDDQGEPIHENAREFLVMTPPMLSGPAMAAINNQILSGGVDNPLRAAGDLKISHQMNPRLSSWTTDFCIFRTDAPTKPFIMQEELGVTMEAIAEGSEEEFKNNRHLFGVKASRNVGYGMWQHAVKATLS